MFAASFVAVALAVGALAQGPQINTPGAGLNACQNYQLTWSGTTGQVEILVYPQGVTAGQALETITNIPSGATSYTWLVDVAPNQSYTFALHDLSSGSTVFSGPGFVSPNPSNDLSCLGSNASNTASAPPATGSASTTPVAPGSPPPATTTGGASPSSPPKGSSTAASASGSSTPTAPPGAASSLHVSAFSGLVGLVAALFLA